MDDCVNEQLFTNILNLNEPYTLQNLPGIEFYRLTQNNPSSLIDRWKGVSAELLASACIFLFALVVLLCFCTFEFDNPGIKVNIERSNFLLNISVERSAYSDPQIQPHL